MRQLRQEFQNILPTEIEARLSEFCTDAAALVKCMNNAGLQELKRQLQEINQSSQNRNFVFLIELLEFFEQRGISPDSYTQIMFNIELLYIRFYMIDEIINKYRKIPSLKINNLRLFRLVFTHLSTDTIFSKRAPYVYFINWLKTDLSEISYRFFDFNGQNTRDEVMTQGANIQTFQDWYNSVYEEV